MWEEIFKLIFFIEPASGNIIIDLFLPIVLTGTLYRISYRTVGEMYSDGLISSSIAGSFFHWFIRMGLVYIVIFAFNLIVNHITSFLPVIAIGILIYLYKKYI
ncbi:hypothetical protein KHQ89_01835 [Mycoplasmatota bacterium]|nr:hypothetical protein KHQ89_01835 [Mycoplasmatota bacterium]